MSGEGTKSTLTSIISTEKKIIRFFCKTRVLIFKNADNKSKSNLSRLFDVKESTFRVIERYRLS